METVKISLSAIFLLQLIPLAISLDYIEKKSRIIAATFQLAIMLSLAIGLIIVWYDLV